MGTYLDAILDVHRARALADRRQEAELAERVASLPPTRPFREALSTPGVAVIAEIKRRSPSKGSLAPHLDPDALARAYVAGGACAISVLTDAPHFGGSPEDLVAARAAVDVPVLRKDFTVDRRDLYDARLMGADACLLIVAALGDAELADFIALGRRLGLTCLVEIHDEGELARALAAGADVIGVNQRDLHTFAVDRDRAVTLSAMIPADIVRIAESGVTARDDVERLDDAGFDAVLVGEALVTADDPRRALASLRGVVGVGS